MISTVKEFGSYKLVKVALFQDDDSGENASSSSTKRISDCAIPANWLDIELLSIRLYNHDTSIFRFALPESFDRLNLPLAAFLLVKCPQADHDGQAPSIRPYTNITDEDAMQREVSESNGEIRPYFELLCKRYDEWGQKEAPTTHFLFTRTDHSYKPPGIVSNYIHRLKPGQLLSFKYNQLCESRLPADLKPIKSLTLLAVGVGIAPMIQIIRQFLRDQRRNEEDRTMGVEHLTLLYGTRTVKDILLRELLEDWYMENTAKLNIVACVGSRWANVHWGAKSKKEYLPPPPPAGVETLKIPYAIGWVNKEIIQEYADPPANDTRVIVCGLPGVYEKLCGYRDVAGLPPHCALAELGYTTDMVIKL